MAWIYQRGGTWWIGYRANGKQFLKSTGKKDKTEAEKELRKVEALYSVKDSPSLLADVYAALSGKEASKVTLQAALDDWLAESDASTSKATTKKYRQIAQDLKDYFKASASAPLLADVSTDALREFLVQKRKFLSASTVNNGYRKIISIFFIRAIKNGQIKENPTLPIRPFKGSKDEEQSRRAFTVQEIQTIYEKCADDFWRFMVVAGFFTGQRLGDLVCLRWGAIDLEQRIIRLVTRKTGRSMQIPIANQLLAVLTRLRSALPSAPAARAHLWPAQAAVYESQGAQLFSNQFYDVLTLAGLAKARGESHAAQKNGRRVKRDVADVSFHCLRHSFVSLLKATGSNQAVAKELVGHSSDAVNDAYTHMPPETLAAAINQLPAIEVK